MTARKIAILGGGASSLFAAWDLVHSDPEAYDITVYQVGWRLGGKGTSGRRSTADKRIEEHGLHLMFGFYENVFRVVREAYAETYKDPTLWQRFFRGEATAVSMIHYLDAAKTQWEPWRVPYPASTTTHLPGDGGDEGVATLFTILRNAVDWLGGLAHKEDIAEPSLPLGAARDAELLDTLDTVRAHIDTMKSLDRDRMMWPLYWAIARRFLELLAPHVPDPAHADRDRERFETLLRYGGQAIEALWGAAASRALLEIVRFVMAVARGLFLDLFMHGSSDWFELDRYDLRAWIHRHGADPASPVINGLYDAVFASYSELGAGSILQAALKAAFLAKGSTIYKMQVGMGDAIFTPLYLALRDRHVKFRFFHRVESLTLSRDAARVESIVLERQVDVEDYDPLVDVDLDLGGRRVVKCWPSEPIWDRLPEAERARIQDGRIDLENHWMPPDPERRITIRLDDDFDEVILGISVAALPEICADLLAEDPPFADHVMRLAGSTTATQAMQLWTVPGRKPQQPNPLVVPNTDPFDTIADMSQLVAAEKHPSGAVGGIHYLCSALREGSPPPPRSARDYPDELSKEAFNNGHTWLTERAPILWQNLSNRGEFDWSALYDPSGGEGTSRFKAQFVHTPRNLSDRYVIPVPMSHQVRLLSNGTRYMNLYITGDWIKTSLSIGCLEAAAMAGIQAARALSIETDNVWVARARGDWIEDVIRRPQVRPHVSPPSPRYRRRDGELLIPPPYQVRCDGLILFLLLADRQQLQAICDSDLNLGPTKYRPYSKFVVLYGTTLSNLTTGTVGEAREGGFWIPVVSDSDPTVRIYSPYVWLDSATSTIVGRSVYGYAKQTGEVEVPTAGNAASLVVTGDALVAGDTGKRLQRTRLFTASPVQPTAWAQQQRRDMSSWPDIARLVAPKVGQGVDEVTGILGGMRSIFLKQLPDVRGATAAYQAIVEAAIVPKLDTIAGRVLDEPWTITIPTHDEPRLVDRLGLAATLSFQPGMSRTATISPVLQLWMQFEGTIEPGTVVYSTTPSAATGSSDG